MDALQLGEEQEQPNFKNFSCYSWTFYEKWAFSPCIVPVLALQMSWCKAFDYSGIVKIKSDPRKPWVNKHSEISANILIMKT